jgi:hypothetical protein
MIKVIIFNHDCDYMIKIIWGFIILTSFDSNKEIKNENLTFKNDLKFQVHLKFLENIL